MKREAPPGFRMATVSEYIHWLIRWMETGKKATHYYSYPFERKRLLVPFEPFRVNGECGASSRSYLIHEKAYFLGGDIGHNDIFLFEEPFVLRTFAFAPVYSDPEFKGLSRELDGFIEEQDRLDRQQRSEYEKELRQ